MVPTTTGVIHLAPSRNRECAFVLLTDAISPNQDQDRTGKIMVIQCTIHSKENKKKGQFNHTSYCCKYSKRRAKKCLQVLALAMCAGRQFQPCTVEIKSVTIFLKLFFLNVFIHACMLFFFPESSSTLQPSAELICHV